MKSQSLLIILTILTHTTLATIITVKQDGTGNFKIIQEAINSSENGDTVLVYPGVYYENIFLMQKRSQLQAFTLLPKTTIISIIQLLMETKTEAV